MKRKIIHPDLFSNQKIVYPGYPISPAEKEQHLYHYTSRKSFGLIWENQTLRFSKRNQMNDVMENNERLWYRSSNIDLIRYYESKVAKYGQISLTMDYDTAIKGCMSDMMWGHYGENGKGVCIEINPSKLKLNPEDYKGPVKYTHELTLKPVLPDVVTEEQIDSFIRKNIKQLFFRKHNCWKGENEFRIISKGDYLDISNAIEKVIIRDDNLALVKEWYHRIPHEILYVLRLIKSGNKYVPAVVNVHDNKNILLGRHFI